MFYTLNIVGYRTSEFQPLIFVYVSAPRECKDRLSTCVDTLTRNGDMCTKQPIYANQHCYHSCGFCNIDDSEYTFNNVVQTTFPS